MPEQSDNNRLILVLGGVSSGKTHVAQEHAEELAGDQVLTVVTAKGRDSEIRRLLALHRQLRLQEWRTLGKPLQVGAALAIYEDLYPVVLLNNLTLFVSGVRLAMRLSLLLLGLVLTVASSGCYHRAVTDATNLPETHSSSTTRYTDESVVTNGSFEEVVVVDRLQREVRFKATPVRIISLTPATTELLFAIDAGKQIVGVTKNCNYPAETEKLNRVGGGTLQSLSRETIVGLQPDLVLCKWDNHQPLIKMLAEFHIPCLAIGAENLEELYTETVILGKVTGHAEKAATLVSQMKEQVDRLATIIKRIPDGKRRKVFYQVWDDPLMTAGPNSFIGEALRLAGLDNIFLDSTTSYPRVSDEVLVSRNPDVIIAPSTHASKVSVDTILNRQGWSEIKAIQEKQVFIIDGDQISRCGPRLLDAIEEIIRVTYPDLVPAEHKEETP